MKDTAAQPRALNLQNVMDLDNTIYFTFRGRAYGAPPLPWLAGERILDAWLRATACGDQLTRESLTEYFAAIRDLEQLIWRNILPATRVRRWLWRLHLLRRPRFTEAEVAELATFLLQRRMSIRSRPRLAKTSSERAT